MSFNGTFGNGSGFTLPSFTTVQPTVSVSGVVTEAGNNTTSTDTENISKITAAESLQHEIGNDLKDENLDGKISDNLPNDTGEKKSDEYKVTQPLINSPTEHLREQQKAKQEESTKELEALLSNRKKNVTPITLNNITAHESNGKGIQLNEESSEDEDVSKELTKEKHNVDELYMSERVKSDVSQNNSVDSDDDDDGVNSFTNEKQGLLDNTKDSVDESKSENKIVSKDEELINQTLDDVDKSDEFDKKQNIPVSVETIHENMKIDMEVEAEVKKIQTNISEPLVKVRSQASNDTIIPHIGRNNSIKDIPNPPLNLKKQQAFDFQTFLAQFKSKDCQHAHKYLKSFLDQFNQRIWTVEEQIKLLNEFEEFLFQKLIQYKPFNEIGNDEIKINNCKEGLEKLIMTKVYNNVFSPSMSFLKLTESHKHDKFMDKKYLTNTYLYNWVELKHLDLDMLVKVESNFITLASAELSKIDEYKSPRDKIVCVLNSSKIIFGLIRQQNKEEENADSFVPLLIYVLLHSKFHRLYSNLQYIERFRNQDFLIGETSYYVSTLQIACNFIINITKDQLTISDEEYELKMDESRKRLREQQQNIKNSTDPSKVLTKSAEMVKQSLSNSINSFIQNITSENGDEEREGEVEGEDNTHERDVHRQYRHRDNLEVSNEELEKIKQLSIKENSKRERQLKEQKELMEQLESMFPSLDKGLIEDVLAGSLVDGGYNVGECVNSLLALSE